MSAPAAKWGRHAQYERIAQARMARAQEALGITSGAAPPLGYSNGDLYALVGREPVGHLLDGTLDLRWHISVNGAHLDPPRVPAWHELVDAAHAIRPGVVFVLGIPPRSWWMAEVASGHHVLHMWELQDRNLASSWMAERTPGGRAPS